MSRERAQLADQYIAKLFAPEDTDLKRAAEALKKDGKFGINVGASEGKILQFLCKLVNAKTVVEVGTLYAYSTLWMAKALASTGKVHSIEYNPENYAAAKKIIDQSEVADRVELHLGDAKEILKKLDVIPDLIFIDADKGGYAEYLDWSLQHIRPGGLIIGDNTFLFGAMFGEDRGERVTEKAKSSMTYFNETIANHPDYFSVMLPTHEGMTLGLRLR